MREAGRKGLGRPVGGGPRDVGREKARPRRSRLMLGGGLRRPPGDKLLI